MAEIVAVSASEIGQISIQNAVQPAKTVVPSDIEIAQAATPWPISQIAVDAGILPQELEPYGSTKAKVHLSILNGLKRNPGGKYVVITAMTPTPLANGWRTSTPKRTSNCSKEAAPIW